MSDDDLPFDEILGDLMALSPADRHLVLELIGRLRQLPPEGGASFDPDVSFMNFDE